MNEVKLTAGGVTVALCCDPSADVGRGKPTPEQWAAFIAAILQALLALFGQQPPSPVPPAVPPGPAKR